MIKPGEVHRFSTPAKINLFLRIQHKRPDGYHELSLDFIPVSLFDQIELRLSDDNQLKLDGNLSNIKSVDNLTVKAVRILEQETDRQFPVHIRLRKNIPTGAGLGGGSGNAAGMLVLLNRLFDLSIPEQRLQTLALQLGADVPFFISPRPSLAGGIGEKLAPLPDFEPLYLLLIYPGFAISTAQAYRKCIISGSPPALSTYNINEICGLTPDTNDFWLPLADIFPDLGSCRSALLDSGACTAGLSGSGSTVFGIFRTKRERDEARSSLEKEENWSIYSCKSLHSFEYSPDRY